MCMQFNGNKMQPEILSDGTNNSFYNCSNNLYYGNNVFLFFYSKFRTFFTKFYVDNDLNYSHHFH